MLGILKDVKYNYEDDFKVLNITLKFPSYSLNFRLEPTASNTSINSIIIQPLNFREDIGQNIKRIEFELYKPDLNEGNFTVGVCLKSLFSFMKKDILIFNNTLRIYFIEDTDFEYEEGYSPLVSSNGLNQPLSLCSDWNMITFKTEVSISYEH